MPSKERAAATNVTGCLFSCGGRNLRLLLDMMLPHHISVIYCTGSFMFIMTPTAFPSLFVFLLLFLAWMHSPLSRLPSLSRELAAKKHICVSTSCGGTLSWPALFLALGASSLTHGLLSRLRLCLLCGLGLSMSLTEG